MQRDYGNWHNKKEELNNAAGMGIAILTGELTSVSYWPLDTFPILARFG